MIMLVVHKVFQRKKISLKNINALYEENRAYGLYNVRNCLIISYKEPSGFSGELVYPYDEQMRELIECQIAVFKKEYK